MLLEAVNKFWRVNVTDTFACQGARKYYYHWNMIKSAEYSIFGACNETMVIKRSIKWSHTDLALHARYLKMFHYVHRGEKLLKIFWNMEGIAVLDQFHSLF